jgi:hypothetical protein
MDAPSQRSCCVGAPEYFHTNKELELIKIALLIYCDFIHNKSTLNVTCTLDESHQPRKIKTAAVKEIGLLK